MGKWSKFSFIRELREQFTSCPGCGRDEDRILRERPNPNMDINMLITAEHLIPRSEGGSNRKENIILICHRCNFTRGAQTPWDWYGAQHLIYKDGWPIPQQFFGKAGEKNRRLWENRAKLIGALLGWGPYEFDADYYETGFEPIAAQTNKEIIDEQAP